MVIVKVWIIKPIFLVIFSLFSYTNTKYPCQYRRQFISLAGSYVPKDLYKKYKIYTERFVQKSTKYLLSYVRYCMSKKSWPILYSNLPHKMDHNYKIGYGRKEFVQKLQNIYRRICPKQSTKYLLSYVRYCMSKKSWPILYSNLYYIKWIIIIR